MADKLLISTDLDRTLIPNGPQPESPEARRRFTELAQHEEVTLAYVSGRHLALVEQAISNYSLPIPDFIIGDVGTTIYRQEANAGWTPIAEWQQEIAQDWSGQGHAEIKSMLSGLADLRLQEGSKQNAFKLSYYVPLHSDQAQLSAAIEQRLAEHQVAVRQIWSVDEPAGVGLLDILPARASKRHAIEALMQMQGFDLESAVFCGDSGNDIEVLVSPIPAVLVGNAQPQVRTQALRLAAEGGHSQQLYIASGGYRGMNGNYAAGMLEGIAHFYPFVDDWLTAGGAGDAP
jgi:sucrose-6F-phosphate phosphohydrolase